jgi:hypothetical protein
MTPLQATLVKRALASFQLRSARAIDGTSRVISANQFLAPLLLVGSLLCPLLLGVEPTGGDPYLMYQPIKQELARALRSGGLPYWSDHFGLGMPLAAESHVAAFYPPNWLFYRLFTVPTAYRLSLWLHLVALGGTTYAYTRTLGLSSPACTVTAIGFSLCGFQAAHAVHEPFVTLMPYLPLCLLSADRYMTSGQPRWLALLALTWGIQVTAGHFQVQMWAAMLVLAASLGRIVQQPRLLWLRYPGLVVGLSWGAAIACTQLMLAWELTQATGFSRPAELLSNFLFPASHWAQWALPVFYLGRPVEPVDSYWINHGTTPGEASAYISTCGLILACIGWFSSRRDPGLGPWRWITPLAFAIATMPQWWPDGFRMLLELPGVGWFRAPGRYTLITSLGLAILAGRGLDRVVPVAHFWSGLGLALLIGAGSWISSIIHACDPLFTAALGPDTLPFRYGWSAAFWVLSLVAVLAWRRGLVRSWGPILIVSVELCTLFYMGPVAWSKAPDLPASSPLLGRLGQEPDVGLVAGRLMNLPVQIGLSVAYPLVGITPPPPNYLIEKALLAPGQSSMGDLHWQRRFGVSHGVYVEGDNVGGTQIRAAVRDPVLDRLFRGSPRVKPEVCWLLVHYPAPAPFASIALRAYEVSCWGVLYTTLSSSDHAGEAWFIHGEEPEEGRSTPARTAEDFLNERNRPRFQELAHGVPAKSAHILSWDSHSAVVEHDGACYLIFRRTHYGGWCYRIDNGPERPVFKVNGGLQCVPLLGTGTTRVSLAYHPTNLRLASSISLGAAAMALLSVLLSAVRTRVG